MTDSNLFDLAGRVAIVTGASSGIGAGVAQALAVAGARTVLVGRDEARLESVTHRIDSAGGDACAVVADLTGESAPSDIVDAALREHEAIDILVHCAGLFFPTPFADITAEQLDGQWQVNVRAPFLLTQTALPHMKRGGSVIFVSSMMGEVGGAMCTAYCATKGAIEQLTKALAVELAERGVRFNCIAPGAIETPMNEGFREDTEFYESFRAFAPAGRWGRVEDIAPAAVFLASPAADFVHGARLAVDGGWVAR